MDWYPLWNSLRIAALSTVIIFFLGILAAYYVAKLPRLVKGVLDVVLTLPLVLPPTVVGYFLLRLLGPKRTIGLWFLETFGVRLTMVWYAAVFASAVVAFPLMYRTARGAFESFDRDLAYAARPWAAQTAGYSGGCECLAANRASSPDGAGLRPRAGRVRRHLDDSGLHAGQDRDDLDHGLPALAHGRRRGRDALGAGEPGDLGRGAPGGEHAGEKEQEPAPEGGAVSEGVD